MRAIRVASTRNISTDQWREIRRRGIGGSDVAPILGLHPSKSAIDVWLEKTGQRNGNDESEKSEWGRRLEDDVADYFAEKHGVKVRRVHAVLRHPEEPRLIANLDRLVYEEAGEAVLEVKTTDASMRSWWEPDNVPDWVMVQIQHYLGVTGLRRGYVAALIGGNHYVERAVERDDELIAAMHRACLDWWARYVEANVLPPADGTEAATEALKRLYPRAERPSVALPDDAEALIAEYEQASEEEKAASERKEAAANRLKALLGDAEIGTLRGIPRVRWTNVTQPRFDEKAFKAAHPSLHAEFVKPIEYRRFGIVKAREERHAA